MLHQLIFFILIVWKFWSVTREVFFSASKIEMRTNTHPHTHTHIHTYTALYRFPIIYQSTRAHLYYITSGAHIYFSAWHFILLYSNSNIKSDTLTLIFFTLCLLNICGHGMGHADWHTAWTTMRTTWTVFYALVDKYRNIGISVFLPVRLSYRLWKEYDRIRCGKENDEKHSSVHDTELVCIDMCVSVLYSVYINVYRYHNTLIRGPVPQRFR